MTSDLDIRTLKSAIGALIGKSAAPLTAVDIQWIAEALAAIFTDYTVDEIASIAARAAAERGDRMVQWEKWDS